jgi:hypothetical protein
LIESGSEIVPPTCGADENEMLALEWQLFMMRSFNKMELWFPFYRKPSQGRSGD